MTSSARRELRSAPWQGVGRRVRQARRSRPAALDDVAYDQDQEIVEQPVERRLAATSFGECFTEKQIADRRQRGMRCERQDHKFRQPLSDRVALSAAELDGRADEIGAALRIDRETVGSTTREKQQGWFIKLEIGLASLDDRNLAALEEVQVACTRVLHRLTQLACEEGSGPRCHVGEKGSEGVHWDDRQRFWHQPSLLVPHIGNVQAQMTEEKTS